MNLELNEIRLHSAISWNKSTHIEQLPRAEKFAPINDVISSACVSCGISPVEFYSQVRVRHCVTARMIVANYLLKYYGFTLSKIGDICGKKDHSTVLHYKRNYIKFINFNDEILCTAISRFNQQILSIDLKFKTL